MPTLGAEKAPDGGLRLFIDLTEHEVQTAVARAYEAPAPSEPAPPEPPPSEPAPAEPAA